MPSLVSGGQTRPSAHLDSLGRDVRAAQKSVHIRFLQPLDAGEKEHTWSWGNWGLGLFWWVGGFVTLGKSLISPDPGRDRSRRKTQTCPLWRLTGSLVV